MPLSQMERLGKKEVRPRIGFVNFEITQPYHDVKELAGNTDLTSKERSKLKIQT